MSTYFRAISLVGSALEPIPFQELFDGRLEKFGIHEDKPENSEKRSRLYDGKNYIWVFDDGGDADFACFGLNDPTHILDTIGKLFNVRIFSEHEPEYHGFATYEEWEAALSSEPEEQV